VLRAWGRGIQTTHHGAPFAHVWNAWKYERGRFSKRMTSRALCSRVKSFKSDSRTQSCSVKCCITLLAQY
jgi:hypothetical protein